MSLTFRITLFQSGSHCWTAPWWAFYAWLISTLKQRGRGVLCLAACASFWLIHTQHYSSTGSAVAFLMTVLWGIIPPFYFLIALFPIDLTTFTEGQLEKRLIWICRLYFSTITIFSNKKEMQMQEWMVQIYGALSSKEPLLWCYWWQEIIFFLGR